MLVLTGITKNYGSTRVLAGAALSCAPGEAVCVAGANAAGKTTLLDIAAGLAKPDGGAVTCDGKIGYLPQENALLEELTARDNLRLWYAACGRPERELFCEGSAEQELGLAPFAKRRVSRLSGGIKKRTALACALAARPAYLIMDEPMAALDLSGRLELTELLCVLKKQGHGLLFSSHDPVAIAGVADRVLLLQKGGLSEGTALSGSREERFEQATKLLSGA